MTCMLRIIIRIIRLQHNIMRYCKIELDFHKNFLNSKCGVTDVFFIKNTGKILTLKMYN